MYQEKINKDEKNVYLMNKTLNILSFIIIILGIIASGFGLFYKTDGQSFDFINQYGDVVKISILRNMEE